MPRQGADGEAQNAPLLAQPGLGQPRTQRRFAAGQRLFQRQAGPAGFRLARAPQRAGGMQIENRQTRVLALGLTGREEAAAVGERQQVAGLGTVPTAVGDPRSQQLG